MRVVVVAMVILLCGQAGATSYKEEPRYEVTSANGEFVLIVDSLTGAHQIYPTRDRAKLAWVFRRRTEMATFLISDDGATVAAVTWKFVHADKLDQPAVELWDARGNFATIAIEDLVAQPPRVRGPGPIGGHWREWLADAYLERDQLVVVTTGPHAYRIELTTGEIVERTHGGRGFLLWLLGTAMLLAIPVVGVLTFRRARRAARESAEDDQIRSFRAGGKLFWVSVLAPIALLLWLALDFAGLPAVPASVVDPLRSAVFAITLVLAPVSIFGAALLPRGSKAVRIAIAIVVPIILLAVRIAY